jgi:hypothetical protein
MASRYDTPVAAHVPVFAGLLGALLIGLLGATPAQAYYSVIDTGELVAPDHYRASIEPQLILNNYDGANLVGRFDTGLDRDSSVRGLIGLGKVIEMGAMYKFVPYPDIGQQPAIGGEAGVVFARVNGENQISLRLTPLISKKFDTKYGGLTPYGSLPIGITSRPGETFVPVQIAGGAELRPDAFKNLAFYAELGINLNRAFSYLSVAVACEFDGSAFNRRR